MSRASPWRLVLAVLIASTPRETRADGFVTGDDSPPEAVGYRALLRYANGKESLLDELEVKNPSAPAFLWYRSLPSPPKSIKPLGTTLFDALADATRSHAPHKEWLKHHAFGPSIISAFTRNREPPPPPPWSALDRSRADRSLEVLEPLILDAPVETSTITRRPVMPKPLRELLAREALKLDAAAENAIAADLQRGWVVLVRVVRDTRPSRETPARIGPILQEFDAREPLIPLATNNGREPLRSRVYAVASRPLQAAHLPMVLIAEPWSDEAPDETYRYQVSFNQKIIPGGPLDFLLRQRQEMTVQEGEWLVRAEVSSATGPRSNIELTDAEENTLLPTPRSRGNFGDLFGCVLLGMTPLFYTPESWLFLWIGANAKARIRREGHGIGNNLWGIYALIVGIFWYVTLEQTARIAALVPFLLGLARLALPYVDRDPNPVRVRFRKAQRKP